VVRRRVSDPGRIHGLGRVKAKHVQEWIITLLGRYSDSYANNTFRALQKCFKWHGSTSNADRSGLAVSHGSKVPICRWTIPAWSTDNSQGRAISFFPAGYFPPGESPACQLPTGNTRPCLMRWAGYLVEKIGEKLRWLKAFMTDLWPAMAGSINDYLCDVLT
jgi:hypothetical protein